MPEFNLKIRRYNPEGGEPPYWAEYTVDLDGHRSVLDGILKAKDDVDGSIGIRCSCQAAICGSCVSDCLSMEVDPLFIGPAALAKAYRFVGDPRDAATEDRLRDLAEDPHGIYDCTHCFSCVQVCPKGVAPMDQIMRLRRRATRDFDIDDSNNGRRHEESFTRIIEKKGTLDERKLLQDSLGPLRPQGQVALLRALPTGLRGFARGKITPRKALFHEQLGGME